GKDFAHLEIFVEVGAVRGKHDRTSVGDDPNALQAAAMPSQFVDSDARGDLGIPIMEYYSAGVDLPHHLADVLDRERTTKLSVTRAGASGVRNLRRLQVKVGIAERVQGSGM